MYLSIFTKTFAGLALTALLAAQALKWDTPEDVRTSGTVLGFSLLMAAIGAVLAVLWALASSPAVTPVGRALRSAIQALLAAPIAAVVLDSTSDFADLGAMLVPTVVAVVLAFLVALAANYRPAPLETATGVDAARTTGRDVLGTRTVG